MKEQLKYHFVYKTTNNVNGKYYIGKHSTNDLEDGYIGSGSLLKKAIKKYGSDNFKRDIIELCDNEEDAYNKEMEIVTDEIVKDPKCYNLICGGRGVDRRVRYTQYYRCDKYTFNKPLSDPTRCLVRIDYNVYFPPGYFFIPPHDDDDGMNTYYLDKQEFEEFKIPRPINENSDTDLGWEYKKHQEPPKYVNGVIDRDDFLTYCIVYLNDILGSYGIMMMDGYDYDYDQLIIDTYEDMCKVHDIDKYKISDHIHHKLYNKLSEDQKSDLDRMFLAHNNNGYNKTSIIRQKKRGKYGKSNY